MMIDFKQKENSLNLAIERVDRKLNYLKDNWQNMPPEEVNKWNNYHDLKDRLIDRKVKNLSDFYEWHFNEFGFNVYSLPN